MIITGIEVQKRNKDRCSVFVDGAYSFSLGIDQLLELGISKGSEVDEATLQRFKDASDFGKLYDAALNKLSRRPHSALEVRQYLRKKQAEDQEIKVILEKLIDRSYLDDHAFAAGWVEQRRTFRRASAAVIRQELRAKGVATGIIEEVLRDDDNEKSALEALILKKRHLTKYQDQKKFMAYLLSKGFRYSDIQSCLSRLEEGQEV